MFKSLLIILACSQGIVCQSLSPDCTLADGQFKFYGPCETVSGLGNVPNGDGKLYDSSDKLVYNGTFSSGKSFIFSSSLK